MLLKISGWATVTLLCAIRSLSAAVVFDSMTNVSTWINPNPAPNTFIGAPFAPSGNVPVTVTGLDAVIVNTGAAISANNLVLNVYFWNSATLATTGLNDVFGNLAGTESISLGARSIAAASKTVLQDATQPSVVPAITLPSLIILNGMNSCVTFNWQVDTGSGLTSLSGLTTAVRAGVALATGGNPIASSNGGYYRNSSIRTDGNFNGADERNNGASTDVAFRLYSVPEPSGALLAVAGTLKFLARNRTRMSDDQFDFPPTDWPLILEADGEPSTGPRLSLNQLLKRYIPAMRRHLVDRRRVDVDRAEDVVQSFITDKMIEKKLLAQADRSRGRFRDLLARSLDNYLADKCRRERSTYRSPGHGNTLISLDGKLHGPSINPVDAFDRSWAESVMSEAVRRTVLRCEQTNRAQYWQLFQGRTFGRNGQPTPYDQLINELGFATPSEAAGAFVTVKRIFARMIRQVLIEHAGGGPDVRPEEELKDLRKILARCSAAP